MKEDYLIENIMKNKTSILIITLILFLGCSFALNAGIGFDKANEETKTNAQIGLAKLQAYMQWIIGQEQQLGGLTGKKKETINNIKKHAHLAWKSINPVSRSRLESTLDFTAIFQNAQKMTTALLDKVDWNQEGSEKQVLDDIKNAEKALIDMEKLEQTIVNPWA